MEINEYRPKQSILHKATSEYEASRIKAQQFNAPKQDNKPVHIEGKEQTIIKGEIIDLRYQDVKIKIEPTGQIISARLTGELPLFIGQTAEFVVSDETDGQITLRYIQASNTPIDDIVHKALYASGFTSSERNIAIVQELLSYQMPIDKNTILHLIKLTSTYPDVDTSTLVLMHKNDLPINIANIAQFEAYQKGTHQLLSQLKSLIGQINTIGANNTLSVVNDDPAPNIIEADKDLASNGNIPANNNEDTTPSSRLQNNIQTEKVLTEDIPSHNTPSSNTHFSNVITIHNELLSLLIDKQGGPEHIYADSTIGHVLPDDELKQLQDTLLSKINEQTYYSDDMAENIKDQLLDASMTLESLLTIIHDLYEHDSHLPFSKGTMLSAHISSAFIGISKLLSESDTEKLVDLLKSDNYLDMITEALHKRWTLSPNELTMKNKVKDFFNRLDKDMERLDELTDNHKISSLQDFKSSINKLQDNLQFMRDLNELFLYLQLPIRLKEQDVHGDLYVFTRKNHKHGDTETLNVLLHLDMANLGSMDIHMSMRDRQINAVFYVEKSSEQIVSMHLHELINIVNDKGYQLQAKTQISDSRPDFINNILQEDAPGLNTHRYSFDIRA